MSWTYLQKTGELLNPDGFVAGVGYSGFGIAKNDPDAETVAGRGPIPEGLYTIGPVEVHPDLGPVVMPLIPDPSNEMHGRSAFFIHGDSREHPGKASHGCIIMARAVREAVSVSADRKLTVVRA